MKRSFTMLAGAVAGTAVMGLLAVGLPRAVAQHGSHKAPAPMLGLPSVGGELAELRDRRSDHAFFDIANLIDRDRGLGRLSMILAAQINDPEESARAASHKVTAEEAMDLRTVAHFHNVERASLYVFEEFNPDSPSLDDIRFYISFDLDNTTGIAQLDPPVRIREGDHIVTIFFAMEQGLGQAEFTLHGTPVLTNAIDSLSVE